MQISKNEKKVIAFYLPQFHSIPENDKWWGKGFTEWTNVKKAEPLFKNHNQPRVPLNNNYYNLLDDNVIEEQSNLAQENGVFGFCYYHYYFKNGKKLLEKPLEMMLENKKITIPYCFCWANENWSRNWDGGNREVICEQDYGDKDEWERHFVYLLQFFKDDRYILVDNKPMFIIYKPELIAKLSKMINYFNKRAIEEGFDGIYLGYQYPRFFKTPKYRRKKFDFGIYFEPIYTIDEIGYKNKSLIKKALVKIKYSFGHKFYEKVDKLALIKRKKKNLTLMDYNQVWENILNRKVKPNVFAGAFVDWDNTPRNKNGLCFYNVSAENFDNYFCKLNAKIESSKNKLIFINAWNEWGEGAYLEPDEKNKYAYLDTIKKCCK